MDSLEARCKIHIFNYLNCQIRTCCFDIVLVSALTVESADNLEMHSKKKHQLSVNRVMTVVNDS